jgi:hypothetical protein
MAETVRRAVKREKEGGGLEMSIGNCWSLTPTIPSHVFGRADACKQLLVPDPDNSSTILDSRATQAATNDGGRHREMAGLVTARLANH